MIALKGLTPFAHGGNRLCFVDPTNPARCIKVRRPEFTLEDMRRKKGFPHTLKPLWMLDESRHENALMKSIHARLGEKAYIVLARNFGFVDTDMGQGLCGELVRNADGRIAYSVMQWVWENGMTPDLLQALDRFEQDWIRLQIPSRALLPHNLVAQCNESQKIERLVVIDGLGNSGLIPFRFQPGPYRRWRAQEKLKDLRHRMDVLLEHRRSGKELNMFWLQRHDGLVPPNSDSEK